MTDLRRRLAYLLSDPDLTEHDLRDFERWAGRGGLAELVRETRTIRRYLREGQPRPASPEAGQIKGSGSTAPRPAQDRTVEQARMLLLVEANLQVHVALRLLADGVRYSNPIPAKKAFASVVRQIADDVGDSKVLSAVQKIRNEVVHDNRGEGWSLRRPLT